ncbi:MAG TPA: heme-binding domain-containing protein [Bdellovibrionota bacterium]|nr:heme-binding domain-containing protein [Bdellovibrionota bacterium]
MKKLGLFLFFLIISFNLFSYPSLGHEKKIHKSIEIKTTVTETPDRLRAYQKIQQTYQQQVEPIFKSSCYDCHSDQVRYPWYHKIPGVKHLIDHDIREGRSHLNCSSPFPFKSHGESPEEDLREIEKAIREKTMPPWRYRILHKESQLTPEQEQTILQWVKNSLNLLKPTKERAKKE